MLYFQSKADISKQTRIKFCIASKPLNEEKKKKAKIKTGVPIPQKIINARVQVEKAGQ